MYLNDISDEIKTQQNIEPNACIPDVINMFGQKNVQHIPGAYLIPQLGTAKWDGHIFISGATGAGKSYLIKQIVERDKKHRKVYLFSMVKDDPSLQGLILHTYDAEIDSLEDSICIFDDFPERDLRDNILETGRHKNTVAIVVNHKHREWMQTLKPLNESKYMILFPSANRGTVLNELRVLGLNVKQRSLLVSMAQHDGRYLIVHQHAPNAIITQQSVVTI